MFRKLFLPAGIAVAIAVSFIWPDPGIAFKALRCGEYLTANNLMIVITFLVCGWNVDVNNTKFDRKFILLFLGGAVLALVISPLIGVGVARIFRLAAIPRWISSTL